MGEGKYPLRALSIPHGTMEDDQMYRSFLMAAAGFPRHTTVGEELVLAVEKADVDSPASNHHNLVSDGPDVQNGITM